MIEALLLSMLVLLSGYHQPLVMIHCDPDPHCSICYGSGLAVLDADEVVDCPCSIDWI